MLKIENIDQLLSFYKEYGEFYCYGAGNYGEVGFLLCKMYDMRIGGFIVSDGQEHSSTFCGVPVYELHEVMAFSKPIAIVLTLDEVHHEVIFNAIQQCCNCINISALSKMFIENTKKYRLYKRERILAPINYIGKFLPQDNCLYEQRAQNLFSRYDTILLRYMDMRQIGAVSSWIFYCTQRQKEKNKIFYLFCPFVRAIDFLNSNRWAGINNYAVEKFVDEGIEVLSNKNIDFWKYVFEKYGEKFDIQPDFDLFSYVEAFNSAVKHNHLKNDNISYVSFSVEEQRKFDNELQKMNIKRPFVCISARNSVFRSQVTKSVGITEDIIDQYRNTDIYTYRKAIEYLREHDVQGVRMGALVGEKFDMDGLIDYAYAYRSEYMDVFLLSQCDYFVSDPSGIQFIAELFSKPLVSINAAVLSTQHDLTLLFDPKRDLTILKKLWDTKGKRFLTIHDMLEMEVEGFIQNRVFDCGPQNTFLNYYERGIVPIDNTEAEIKDVIEEMHLRLQGKWKSTPEDDELQKRYQEIVYSYPMKSNFLFNWRIGAKFLRDNKWLLQDL